MKHMILSFKMFGKIFVFKAPLIERSHRALLFGNSGKLRGIYGARGVVWDMAWTLYQQKNMITPPPGLSCQLVNFNLWGWQWQASIAKDQGDKHGDEHYTKFNNQHSHAHPCQNIDGYVL